MLDFLKTLVGLLEADSKLDKVVVLVKEATLVVVAAIAILQAAATVLQAFLTAAGVK